MSLSHKAMLVCIFGSLAMPPTAVYAAAQVAPGVALGTQAQTEEKRKTLMADATSAIAETQNALKQLDDGKKQDALAALERATGKLEIILARDPSLTLAPAGVNVMTVDIQGGIDAVQKVRTQAEDSIEDGRLQEARRLLKNLASETVISVVSIPLATYPAAIKEAVKLIDREKIEEAKRVLQTALNTQVVTETVIPLPIVNAQAFLKTAETLAEKTDRAKDDNASLSISLNKARSQLEFAQALGYGTKGDLEKFYRQITEIEQKTADNKFGTGLFAKIKASIAELLKANQPAKPQ
jgi:hypothetical protein